MAETTQMRDVTGDIRQFYERFSTGERGEVAAHIPGLLVFARDGLLRASTEVHEGGWTHQSSYTRTEEHPMLEVRSLNVHRRTWGDRIGQLATNQLPLVVTHEFLDTVDFKVDETAHPERTEADKEVHDRIATYPERVNVPATDIVGFEHELYVSASRPLEVPITIPRRSEYGVAAPLYMHWVDGLTLLGNDDNRQVQLRYDEYHDHSTWLRAEALADLEFSVRPVAQTPEWLASSIVRSSQDQRTLDQARDYAERFNALSAKEQHQAQLLIDRSVLETTVRVFCRFDPDSGQFGGLEEVATRLTPGDNKELAIAADKIMFRNDQPFVVDEQRGVAYPLSQVRLVKER